jgi:L-histidine N-alpha-methyltransferase
MRLRTVGRQTVHLPAIDLTVSFDDGEELRTEISAKFRRQDVAAELTAAGFRPEHWWTDSQQRFGLTLAVPA